MLVVRMGRAGGKLFQVMLQGPQGPVAGGALRSSAAGSAQLYVEFLEEPLLLPPRLQVLLVVVVPSPSLGAAVPCSTLLFAAQPEAAALGAACTN